MKRNRRAIPALLLALVMCLSLLPLSVFAEEQEQEEDPLVIAALSDSMGQGYQFLDYNENAAEGHYCGWQGSSEKGYIKEFASELEWEYDGPVELADLTIQGLQPDEVYAFLKPETFDFDSMTRGARKHIGWWTGDYATDEEQDPNTFIFETFEDMSDYYIDAIKRADIVLYDIGENYFGTYLTDARDENETISNLVTNPYYKRLLEGFRSALVTAMNLAGVELPADALDGVLYACASYMIYSDLCIAAIRELNPTAQIVLIPLDNPHQELSVKVGGLTIEYSTIINIMMGLLNKYMAETSSVRSFYTIAKLNGHVTSFADELYFYPDDISEDTEVLLGRALLGNNSVLGMELYPAPAVFGTVYDGTIAFAPEAAPYLAYMFYMILDPAEEVHKDNDGNYLMYWNRLDRLLYGYISEKYGEAVAYNDFFGSNYIDVVLSGEYPDLNSVMGDTLIRWGYPDMTISPELVEDARAAIEDGTAADWQKHIVEAYDVYYRGNWLDICKKAATYRTFPMEDLMQAMQGNLTGLDADKIITLLQDPDSATEEDYIALHLALRFGQAARGFGAHPCPRGLEVKHEAVLDVFNNTLRDQIPGMYYSLIVHFVDENGEELDSEFVAIGSGREYELAMPDIWGYRYDPEVISGVMGTETQEVTVTVTYVVEDVTEEDYFSTAVDWAAAWGVTQGTDETHFSPEEEVTRGQMVTFLWRMFGCEEVELTDQFTDVESGSYYEMAVAWAAEYGITLGTTETTFEPEAVCTRAQVVTFLWRTMSCPEAEEPIPFEDVESGSYYEDAVEWAAEFGVVQGTTATTFEPETVCNRAQAVTFLFRLFYLLYIDN